MQALAEGVLGDQCLHGSDEGSGLATGDFTSRYQIRFETSTVGAALEQMNGQHRLIVDAAYQGPCPAGMSPGEMELPGERRISALDISNPAPGH